MDREEAERRGIDALHKQSGLGMYFSTDAQPQAAVDYYRSLIESRSMTDPTTERTPVQEARRAVIECWNDWKYDEVDDRMAVLAALEESIRADESSRWREAVEEYLRLFDAEDWGVVDAEGRLRAMLNQEEAGA